MKKLLLTLAVAIMTAGAASAQFYTPKAAKAEANKTLTERNGNGPAKQAAITPASNQCCINNEPCCNPPQECCFPKPGTGKAAAEAAVPAAGAAVQNCTPEQNCANPQNCTPENNCAPQQNCTPEQNCN